MVNGVILAYREQSVNKNIPNGWRVECEDVKNILNEINAFVFIKGINEKVFVYW